MKMRNAELAVIAIIIISFLVSAYFYPSLPDKVASHWDAQGQVNGYSSKAVALFLLPAILLFLLILFMLIPRIDPLKKNIEDFRANYDIFIVLLSAFLFYVQLLTLAWNYGTRFNMVQVMAPALAALFFYIGILLENSKMNWFIGIRTPWTMSSENVWNKTNKRGAILFKACAVLSLFGVIVPDYSVYLIAIPIILVAIYSFVYSYLEYKKEKGN